MMATKTLLLMVTRLAGRENGGVVGDHTSDLTIVHIDFNEKKSLYYYQQYNFETPSRLLYVWAVQSLVT